MLGSRSCSCNTKTHNKKHPQYTRLGLDPDILVIGNIRRRIELIQDFEMPALSTTVRVSKDGEYVLATGTYKPRVRCYDVNNLSMKFERCFDADVVTFEILSDDYSKLVFLHTDRYVEFHSAQGHYHRLRIPKFGRDMQYHYPTCDLYIVGA
ncbi:unnamed protein product, partial [Timema podura]|nr:unnamed protein product [Timema podura]